MGAWDCLSAFEESCLGASLSWRWRRCWRFWSQSGGWGGFMRACVVIASPPSFGFISCISVLLVCPVGESVTTFAP